MWSPLSWKPPERGGLAITRAGKDGHEAWEDRQVAELFRQGEGKHVPAGRRERRAGLRCARGTEGAGPLRGTPSRYVELDEVHLLGSRRPRGRGGVEAGYELVCEQRSGVLNSHERGALYDLRRHYSGEPIELYGRLPKTRKGFAWSVPPVGTLAFTFTGCCRERLADRCGWPVDGQDTS